jgi:serine/threonine protein phosphatase PrpC
MNLGDMAATDRQMETLDGSGGDAYEVSAAVVTDVGCRRAVNEDCGRFVRPAGAAALLNKGFLAVVADGMGGHAAGETASRLAVDVVSRAYYEAEDEAGDALAEAFARANREIFEAARRDESLRGMGTTCTALALRGGIALCAHVGDSRLYMVRGGEVYLMTEDHSEVQELVNRGVITREEARRHADKNVILRAMGTQKKIEVSTWDKPLPVRAGDSFVICSDGLHDLVEDSEIKDAVVAARQPQVACERLVALAKERGGHDNITVALVSLFAAGASSEGEVGKTRELSAVELERLRGASGK